MKTKWQRSLCWMRRDLRLTDHTALWEACKNSEQVIIVFVFDSNILSQLKDVDDRRVSFIYDALKFIQLHLEQLKSQLVVLHGDPKNEIPAVAQRLGVEAVFANEDYEFYAKTRDQLVSKALKQKGVEFYKFKDQVVFAGSDILKADGKPYQVFTPYKKAWLKKFKTQLVVERKPNLKKLISRTSLQAEGSLPQLEEIGFQHSNIKIPTGENAAKKFLAQFRKKIDDYAKDRDFPERDGTSRISVHLRFGTLSIRAALRLCLGQKKSQGARIWLSELIWREFYFMILDQFPYVEKQAFKKQYDKIKWPGKPNHFKAWCEGRTGFPIVDAGMRQLNATGFMHNRLRMITASFLVKDLLIDWRKGEAYFARKLLDFDLAANNGGWQWCASTGCDAQPYFRIFNPCTQMKKFDPEGIFLKKWVPEYFVKNSNYPKPIVDHYEQRKKAIRLYRELPV